MTTQDRFIPQLFVLGSIVTIALIVWLLPGRTVIGLTPRQLELKQVLGEVLSPLGRRTEDTECRSGFKSVVYYSCEVSDLPEVGIAAQLHAQGWMVATARSGEVFRYTKPSMVAVLERRSSGVRQDLTILHSAR